MVKYLANNTPKEIHELDKTIDTCKIREIKEDHKLPLKYYLLFIILLIFVDILTVSSSCHNTTQIKKGLERLSNQFL